MYIRAAFYPLPSLLSSSSPPVTSLARRVSGGILQGSQVRIRAPNNHRCLFLWRAYKYQSRLCQCTTPADELYVIFKPLICIQLQYLFMSAANRLAAGSSMATLLANELRASKDNDAHCSPRMYHVRAYIVVAPLDGWLLCCHLSKTNDLFGCQVPPS